MPESGKKTLQTNFVSVNNANKEVMRRLVDACFPVTYSDDFYLKVIHMYADLSRFLTVKDVIVGGVVCRIETNETTKEPYAHLLVLLVLDKYRRFGLAKKMLDFVLEQLQKSEKKPAFLSLHVQKANKGAVDFYLAQSFAVVEEIEDYYTNLEESTAYLMKKEL